MRSANRTLGCIAFRLHEFVYASMFIQREAAHAVALSRTRLRLSAGKTEEWELESPGGTVLIHEMCPHNIQKSRVVRTCEDNRYNV